MPLLALADTDLQIEQNRADRQGKRVYGFNILLIAVLIGLSGMAEAMAE